MPGIKIVNKFETELFRRFVQSADQYQVYNVAEAAEVNSNNVMINSLQKSFNTGYLFTGMKGDDIIFSAALNRSEWDSAHFGYECFFINNLYFSNALSDNEIKNTCKELFSEVLIKAKELNAVFISSDIPSQSYNIAAGLHYIGFKYILSWLDGVYKSRKLPDVPLTESHTIGLTKENEIEEFAHLAKLHYYQGGRFFIDSNFDRILVQEMYANLVRSSFTNGDIMISYRIKNKPVALFICKKPYISEKGMTIAPLRFLLTDPAIRGEGIGRQLFLYTLNYLSNNCDYITTGLEVHNLPSLNLHTQLGFKFTYQHNVFHWWNA